MTVAAPTWREALAGLRIALREARDDVSRDPPQAPRTLLSVAEDAGSLDPLDWFRAARTAGSDVAYWSQPTSGRAFVGIGTAASVDLSGPDRFRTAAISWESLVKGSRVAGSAWARHGAGPILLGGATFADGPSGDSCWTGFEHGRLDVPQITIAVHAGQATITVTERVLPRADPTLCLSATLDEVDRVIAAWPTSPVSESAEQPPVLMEVGGQPGRSEWTTSVARSAGAVGRGRIDKVVLARRVDLRASAAIDPAAVLERLAAPTDATEAPVTVFAFTRGERTFVGASPERLVEARGRLFRTIALAGTTGRSSEPSIDARLAGDLLASEKDREEHAVVVDMLRETLSPLAVRLDIQPTPHTVTLPTLQHLASEASGELRDDLGILDLVDRLHPTPAVGGWPRKEAEELLAEQEHLDRGWYAAPVGWVDAQGDGEFVVAIRSGVIEGDHASVFVGCGIVGDSEPDREWAESSMKLEGLVMMLGRLGP